MRKGRKEGGGWEGWWDAREKSHRCNFGGELRRDGDLPDASPESYSLERVSGRVRGGTEAYTRGVKLLFSRRQCSRGRAQCTRTCFVLVRFFLPPPPRPSTSSFLPFFPLFFSFAPAIFTPRSSAIELHSQPPPSRREPAQTIAVESPISRLCRGSRRFCYSNLDASLCREDLRLPCTQTRPEYLILMR